MPRFLHHRASAPAPSNHNKEKKSKFSRSRLRRHNIERYWLLPHPRTTLPRNERSISRTPQVQPRRQTKLRTGLCFRCASTTLSRLTGYPVERGAAQKVKAAKGPDSEASVKVIKASTTNRGSTKSNLPQASPPIGPSSRPSNGATCGSLPSQKRVSSRGG